MGGLPGEGGHSCVHGNYRESFQYLLKKEFLAYMYIEKCRALRVESERMRLVH